MTLKIENIRIVLTTTCDKTNGYRKLFIKNITAHKI